MNKIIVALGLLFLVSCGKDQKPNPPQNTSKETKLEITKKKNKTDDKTNVVVEQDVVVAFCFVQHQNSGNINVLGNKKRLD